MNLSATGLRDQNKIGDEIMKNPTSSEVGLALVPEIAPWVILRTTVITLLQTIQNGLNTLTWNPCSSINHQKSDLHSELKLNVRLKIRGQFLRHECT